MTKPNALHALSEGDMIEEFQITRVLGAGSFGIVYECQNVYLTETAVIKEFLPAELAYRKEDGQVTPISEQTEESFRWARARFLQEAKTLWELARPERHPNIVRVTRYCEAKGTAYMFMQPERGRSLADILKTQGPPTPEQLGALFFPLLDGLERIHAANIVHRDIKPANILIRDDGSPVLIDFGASRRIVDGGERSMLSTYTPVFAALEQYHDVGEQGPWTDIYAFGATLYQTVTGRKPLSASERLCGGILAPATEECLGRYPNAILEAIDRALAIKPEDRPQSVREWRLHLADGLRESEEDASTVVLRAHSGDNPTLVATVPTQRKPADSAPNVFERSAPAGTGKRTPARAKVWPGVLLVVVLVGVAGSILYYSDMFSSPFQPEPPEPVEISVPPIALQPVPIQVDESEPDESTRGGSILVEKESKTISVRTPPDEEEQPAEPTIVVPAETDLGETRHFEHPPTLPPENGREQLSPPDEKALRVRLAPSANAFRSLLANSHQYLLTSENPDLIIEHASDRTILCTPRKERIASIPTSDPTRFERYVRHQAWIKRVSAHHNPNERFDIKVDLAGKRRSGPILEGEPIVFAVSAEQTAHILLLVIDPEGKISVLYPFTVDELVPLGHGEIRLIPDTQTQPIVATPPFGVDHVFALGFEDLPGFFREIMAKQIEPGTTSHGALKKLLLTTDPSPSRAMIRLVTRESLRGADSCP